MLDEDFSKCSPILRYGRDSLGFVFMFPLQDSIKGYLPICIILNLHFIFFSWYVWWLGVKHDCSLNLLFQAILAMSSTLHMTILHINPLNRALVIKSSWRVQHMNSYNFPWTRSIRISQCKHLSIRIVINYQNHAWGQPCTFTFDYEGLSRHVGTRVATQPVALHQRE